MKDFVPQLYRGLSWLFLYLCYVTVLFAAFGMLVHGTPARIEQVLVTSVWLFVAALASRLAAWLLEDFVLGSFQEWNAS